MYSSYYTPKDRQTDILTDHEALHRDLDTHRSIQSDESVLRPIDLETIMSSKGVVKYWYLHRPKTMDYVHKNVTKIQSLGRAFAVRQLKKKYGAEYVADLARADASKREAEKLAEMSVKEREEAERANAEYEARVEEARRQRREQMEAEAAAEALLRAQQAEELRLRQEAEAEAHRQEEERARAAAEALRLAEEAAEKLRLEQEAAAEKLRLEEEAAAEKLRLEEEAEAQAAREYAAKQKEADEEAARVAAVERARQEAEKAAQRERELKEAALAAAAAVAQRAKEDKLAAEKAKIEAEKNELYEQSLSKDVPVVVRNHGTGRVISYDKEDCSYTVRMEAKMGGLTITVKASEVDLDDDRILSPRTVVDTPFGTGEVIGLDPHVGCYAVNTEINAPDGEQFLAFVQIGDVVVHVEEKEERAIVEDTAIPIPDEINLLSARIVDSRVVNRTGKKFIQFKLEIKTSNYGTVYCWKRYSTFRSLCERLQKEAGYARREIPELPKRQIMGNFSQKTIGERAEKLNLFLNAAVKAEHLQWGIRVDDQIAVYKRRVKRPGAPPSTARSGGVFSTRRR